ncbi:SDR family NAD(P)-dependent oxidoreductase [Phenylobacterium sp.]|uniref:SDR family NAD(P)-dependent oxidoreductase n=1 Tax=Phenylobacterium sp. TaxID=1871053 RepID=UPI002734824E|nr:SDR family NAD(P)-dependent oxidoreductase [Phenylobacterium sp.]MDP3853281.1 SDR family NAD(P)-dependent oxidoreductase [Phenylobacterium sp.]
MTASLPLDGKIALVTGATRGIGRACALALAQAGAQVVAVGRTQGALETLDDEIKAATGKAATLAPLDLMQGDAIDGLGLAIHQRFGKLDILVHAAAILGGLTPVSHIDPPAWDKVFSSNVTSTYRLIRSTERLLRESEAGRGIFFTTGRVERPKAFWGAYGASKAALEHLVRTWADELENTPIRAVLVDPGTMRTKMRAEAMPGEDPMTLPEPAEIGPMIVELAQADLGLPKVNVRFSDWAAAGKLASA